MIINWDRWFRRDSSTLFWIGFMSIVAAIVFLWTSITQPSVNSTSDIYLISGELGNYSFRDGFRGSKVYTFQLENFRNSFQISADFVNDFYRSKFQQLQGNEILIVGIAKQDSHLLNTSGTIRVFHINSPDKTYLELKDTIQTHNSKFAWFASAAFFIVGVTSIYFAIKAKEKTPIW
jgi:hypothetical protein